MERGRCGEEDGGWPVMDKYAPCLCVSPSGGSVGRGHIKGHPTPFGALHRPHLGRGRLAARSRQDPGCNRAAHPQRPWATRYNEGCCVYRGQRMVPTPCQEKSEKLAVSIFGPSIVESKNEEQKGRRRDSAAAVLGASVFVHAAVSRIPIKHATDHEGPGQAADSTQFCLIYRLMCLEALGLMQRRELAPSLWRGIIPRREIPTGASRAAGEYSSTCPGSTLCWPQPTTPLRNLPTRPTFTSAIDRCAFQLFVWSTGETRASPIGKERTRRRERRRRGPPTAGAESQPTLGMRQPERGRQGPLIANSSIAFLVAFLMHLFTHTWTLVQLPRPGQIRPLI